MDHRNIEASGADGQRPDHAVFCILVADVDATCTIAAQLGGSVISELLDPGPGAPTFAHLRNPSGNRFGVLTPPSA